MLKKSLLHRFFNIILGMFFILVILISFYFYFSSQTQVGILRAVVDVIRSSIPSEASASINLSIIQIQNLFFAQIITFFVIIFCLIILSGYLFRIYSIEHKNALIDPLTQLYNRRAILMGLKNELRRADRYGHSVSIAIFDIDYFKQFNDNNGHDEGDVALKRFAHILKTEVRDTDFVGRIGGEEFLAVFPEINMKEARIICERIRDAVEKTHFPGEEKLSTKKVTVSIGVSGRGKGVRDEGSHGKLLKAILKDADKKLYEVKSHGRNGVR